jgi:hypothetical protein
MNDQMTLKVNFFNLVHERYNRIERLKKLLFEINSEGESINMDSFFDIVTFKALGLEVKKRESTYYEYLFL